MGKAEPVRWELGEQIYDRYPVLPGFFVFVYAGVIGYKWLARLVASARPQKPLLQLPPPLKALPPPDPTRLLTRDL